MTNRPGPEAEEQRAQYIELAHRGEVELDPSDFAWDGEGWTLDGMPAEQWLNAVAGVDMDYLRRHKLI